MVEYGDFNNGENERKLYILLNNYIWDSLDLLFMAPESVNDAKEVMKELKQK